MSQTAAAYESSPDRDQNDEQAAASSATGRADMIRLLADLQLRLDDFNRKMRDAGKRHR
ncbi:MAG: hypothetical protein ACJ72O_05295 [Marmoricola sp.]